MFFSLSDFPIYGLQGACPAAGITIIPIVIFLCHSTRANGQRICELSKAIGCLKPPENIVFQHAEDKGIYNLLSFFTSYVRSQGSWCHSKQMRQNSKSLLDSKDFFYEFTAYIDGILYSKGAEGGTLNAFLARRKEDEA